MMFNMDFFQTMEQELNSLGGGAKVENVPQSMIPTERSLEKMHKYLAEKIKENNKKAILSYGKAAQFPLG